MTIEIDALKRIIRDGVGLNKDSLMEMVSEIERLRVEVRELEYALDASRCATVPE